MSEQLKVDEFRNGIATLLSNGLPECVNLDNYLGDFEAAWANNPTRGFLRLSDDDQRKVWQGIQDHRREAAPDRGHATLAQLRASLTSIVRDHPDVEDIIFVLSLVIDDHSVEYARQTGDYEHAAHMQAIAKQLRAIEENES